MTTNSSKQRNLWIWLIVIWFFASGILSLASFFAVQFGAIPLSPSQRADFDRLGMLDHLAGVLSATLNVGAAISLFRLRRLALYLFWAAFAISVLLAGWQATGRGLGGSLVELGIGLCLLGAACIYTQKLGAQRVLS